MHIAFITSHFPFYNVKSVGGIGTSIKNLALALIKKGIAVSVFIYGQTEDVIFYEEDIKIHLIKDQEYKMLGWYLHRKHIQDYINKYILIDQIDLIEAPDWTGITAFMNLKVPVIIRFHGSDTYFCYLEERKQKLKNFWFEKLAINRARAFIAPTSFAGEVSQKLFSIKNKTIKTIHHGLQPDQFLNTDPLVYENGLILYVGAIIRKKGVFELPVIFNKVRKKYPDAKLVLIGSDSYDIKSKSKSTWELVQKELSDEDEKKVDYLGNVPYQEVQEYIKKAHVCVFPSFAETLGMVTIESMALHKAVVNSNMGWAKKLIIDKKSGFLVHPKNHYLYAERIIQLLEENSFCLQMGENARARFEAKFDINKLVKKNIEFYKKIITQNLKQ